jgi:peptidyl-prolyl cis-trans isomerase B (cyclophilin B)
MRIRKILLIMFLAALMVVTTALPTGCQTSATTGTSGTSVTTTDVQPTNLADLHGYVRSDDETLFVAITTDQDEEAIIIQLYPEKAPVTVANFQKLVGKGFYDGLTFHRVVDSYLIQGGDPSGNGSGGPGYTIKGEFTSNGVENDLRHVRGTVSMARTDKPDTAGSQFFICQKAIDSLDGDYAAFGKVIEGMTVVDRIAAVPNSGSPSNRPTEKQVMKEVFFVQSDNAG